MREIKFKGKRVGDGKWVHGLPVAYLNKTYILELTNFEEDRVYEYYPHKEMWSEEIIPETVGQYTGLKDKNGTDIYEGDILKDTLGWVFEVRWDDENGRFLGYHSKPRGDIYICYVGREPASTIIGNIWENPELLK